MLLPADHLEICPNPNATGPDGNWFAIRRSVVDLVEEHGPIWKFECLRLIPGVLANPLKVYGGLGRDDTLGAMCYCGRPDHGYEDDGSVGPAPEGCFFVVYLEPISGGSYRVWDWGWRLEDPAAPGNPVNWQSFEKGEIWPPT